MLRLILYAVIEILSQCFRLLSVCHCQLIILFQEAATAIRQMPMLLLQPLWVDESITPAVVFIPTHSYLSWHCELLQLLHWGRGGNTTVAGDVYFYVSRHFLTDCNRIWWENIIPQVYVQFFGKFGTVTPRGQPRLLFVSRRLCRCRAIEHIGFHMMAISP